MSKLANVDVLQTTEMYTRADPSIKLEALNAGTAPHLLLRISDPDNRLKIGGNTANLLCWIAY